MSQRTVIVQFDPPKRPTEQAFSGGLGSAPTYRRLERKGPLSKHYLNGDARTGGVYLWENRAAAEAWYKPELVASLTERFGVEPRLTWYDTHVVVDNAAGEARVDGVSAKVFAD